MTVTLTTRITITVATTTYVAIKLTGVSELVNTELGDWSVEIELGDCWTEAVEGAVIIIFCVDEVSVVVAAGSVVWSD